MDTLLSQYMETEVLVFKPTQYTVSIDTNKTEHYAIVNTSFPLKGSVLS